MKQYHSVKSTAELVPSLQVDVDTVYVRSNIIRIETDEFVGWQYDEVQYTLREYMEILAKQEEVEKLEERLSSPIEIYENLDKSGILLEELKRYKLDELNEHCTRSIKRGFEFEIDEVNYLFSSSLEAQSNFQATNMLFNEGMIESAEWTVVNAETDIAERVVLTKELFNEIKMVLFIHVNSQITRFRNVLQPQVLSASTVEEVDSITW